MTSDLPPPMKYIYLRKALSVVTLRSTEQYENKKYSKEVIGVRFLRFYATERAVDVVASSSPPDLSIKTILSSSENS